MYFKMSVLFSSSYLPVRHIDLVAPTKPCYGMPLVKSVSAMHSHHHHGHLVNQATLAAVSVAFVLVQPKDLPGGLVVLSPFKPHCWIRYLIYSAR